MTDEKKVPTYKKMPYRGKPFLFKNDDPTRNKPARGYESHARVFCTSDKTDMKDLAEIYTKARKGIIYLEDKDKHCLETDNKCVWYIYLVWTDKFYTNPE